MIRTVCLFIVVGLISVLRADIVIDHAGSFDDYPCFRSQGISQVIIRAYHSYGSIDKQAQANIKKSNAAGLATDVYMFPCRGKDGAIQVNELLSYLNGMKDDESAFSYTTGTIWIDVQTNPSTGCSWSQGTSISNCEYLQTIVNELKKNARSVGIYASNYMWNSIFGSADNCKYFTDIPLWYAHYDSQQNFNDWTSNKFGGWDQPTLKQFSGNSKVCGFGVDLSFF